MPEASDSYLEWPPEGTNVSKARTRELNLPTNQRTFDIPKQTGQARDAKQVRGIIIVESAYYTRMHSFYSVLDKCLTPLNYFHTFRYKHCPIGTKFKLRMVWVTKQR